MVGQERIKKKKSLKLAEEKKLAIKWQTASKSIVINAMGQKYWGKTLKLIISPNSLLFKDKDKITPGYKN